MTSAKMWMSAPLTSTPLMSEMALAFGEMWPEMSSSTLSRTKGLGQLTTLDLVGKTSSVSLTLVGHDEDDGGGVLDRLDNVGDGDDVVAQRNVGEVLDVDVLLVDDVGQLAAVDLRSCQRGLSDPAARLHIAGGNGGNDWQSN